MTKSRRPTPSKRKSMALTSTALLLASSAVMTLASSSVVSPSSHRVHRKKTFNKNKPSRDERRRAKLAAKRAAKTTNQAPGSTYHQMQYAQLPPSPPLPARHPLSESEDLVPTFSCGSIWTEATTCSRLCTGTGRDDECPGGEACYAGIPCPQSLVPQEERMASIMDEGRQYQSRFVCGTTYEQATASCASSSALEPRGGSGSVAALFCATGLSGECPASMSCYAGVLCPVDDSASTTMKTEELIPVDEPLTQNSTEYAQTQRSAAKGYYLSDVVFSTSKLLGGFFQGRSSY